jgi:hypothetical protein
VNVWREKLKLRQAIRDNERLKEDMKRLTAALKDLMDESRKKCERVSEFLRELNSQVDRIPPPPRKNKTRRKPF